MPIGRRGFMVREGFGWAPGWAYVRGGLALRGGGFVLVLGGPVALTIAADYLTGRAIQFPMLYLLPIALAAWCKGLFWGGILALTLPWMRLGFGAVRPEVWSGPQLVVNAAIRLLVFFIFAYLIDRLARQQRDLQRDVRVLRGLLPICAHCKKIRSDTNEWVDLERYISDHSDATFSHGLCEACLQQHYPEFYQKRHPLPPSSDGVGRGKD